MENRRYTSLLQAVSNWNTDHESEYPEVSGLCTEIEGHQFDVLVPCYVIAVRFGAIISADIGNHFEGTYIEAPYSEDSEITDVNIHSLEFDMYTNKGDLTVLKPYQRKGIEELIENKLKIEIHALC